MSITSQPEADAQTLWARSEQGKAVFQASWLKLRELGLVVHVDCGQLTQILFAGIAAAARVPEPMDDPEDACVHDWHVVGTQDAAPWVPAGSPLPHTAVLTRCQICGKPESWLLIGEWTMQQLTADRK